MSNRIKGRACDGCTLCCTLLPINEANTPEDRALVQALTGITIKHGVFKKAAGVTCQHVGCDGCSIYNERPGSCRAWSCLWLHGMRDLVKRPDEAGYCVDPVPDYVTMNDKDNNLVDQKLLVVQVWVDPNRPDAHRDPDLRSFLDRMARERGCAALVRIPPPVGKGIVLFPPSLLTGSNGKWHEVPSQLTQEGTEHTHEEITAVIAEQYGGRA